MIAALSPDLREQEDLNRAVDTAGDWQTVVWNDPVNLMSYVVRVLRTYFGYPTPRATELMLAVHTEGHAVVSEGPREQMEMHARAMHDRGLWATVRRAPR